MEKIMLSQFKIKILLSCCALAFTACHAENSSSSSSSAQQAATAASSPDSVSSHVQTYKVEQVDQLNGAYAITTVNDQRLMKTENKGKLQLLEKKTRKKIEDIGNPQVAYGGQSGLGEVTLRPDFAKNQWIYLTYAEQDQ